MGQSLLSRAFQGASDPDDPDRFARLLGPELLAAIARRRRLLGPPQEGVPRILWRALARTEQILPSGEDWLTWLILAGRGFGKTRVGAETVVEWVRAGECGRLAIIAPTAGDARDVMVEGESGIMAVSEADGFPADYEPSKRRVTWPNGAVATLYSAQEPDRLRGPQHDGAWCDEIASWGNAMGTWDQMQFGMRLGRRPRVVVTTTPRPVPIIRKLVADLHTAVTRGSTFDNADNLAPSFLENMKATYEGTRLGRQELFAEILDDNPGALWKGTQLEKLRVINRPALKRIGVGVDPAVSTNPKSNETGIVTAGVGLCSCKGTPELHGFVFDDRSGILTPDEWAKAVAAAYHDSQADRVVPEVNNGGDLVISNLRTLGDKDLAIATGPNGRPGVHASRGKLTRAEPIAALYEQGKVHHVGTLAKLEDQMTQWNPLLEHDSPDRVDALVWVLTWLMLEKESRPSWADVL